MLACVDLRACRLASGRYFWMSVTHCAICLDDSRWSRWMRLRPTLNLYSRDCAVTQSLGLWPRLKVRLSSRLHLVLASLTALFAFFESLRGSPLQSELHSDLPKGCSRPSLQLELLRWAYCSHGPDYHPRKNQTDNGLRGRHGGCSWEKPILSHTRLRVMDRNADDVRIGLRWHCETEPQNESLSGLVGCLDAPRDRICSNLRANGQCQTAKMVLRKVKLSRDRCEGPSRREMQDEYEGGGWMIRHVIDWPISTLA